MSGSSQGVTGRPASPRASTPAISVHGLRKTYGENEAVRGIDFEVAPGEVFGFLGPNGAGKTTTIEILEGFTVVMLSFVSGIFIQLDTLPNWMADIGRIFPLYHLAAGLQTTVAQDPSGIGLNAGDVIVLALWGLAAIRIATKSFKWEPQGRAGDAS